MGAAFCVILSHQHEFIFMHCRKAAGTTVKVAFAKHLGPNDINLGAWHESGMQFNRRFWRDLAAPAIASRLAWSVLKSRKLPTFRALSSLQKRSYAPRLGPMPEHTSAVEARAAFPKEWNSYFKFCFVRNPYEQAVSAWLYRQREIGEQYPFSLYLDLCAAGEKHRYIPERFSNWPIYTIDDKIAVDFVGRHERLATDMAEIFKTIGLPFGELPEANRRSQQYNYRDHYTDRDRRLASRLFNREIEAFQYTF